MSSSRITRKSMYCKRVREMRRVSKEKVWRYARTLGRSLLSVLIIEDAWSSSLQKTGLSVIDKHAEHGTRLITAVKFPDADARTPFWCGRHEIQLPLVENDDASTALLP